MKPTKSATHLVLLRPTSEGMLWLEVRRENDSLHILSAGLEPAQSSESNSEETLSISDQLTSIQAKLKLGWMTKHEIIVIAPSHRLTARFLDTPPVEEDTLDDLVAFEVSEALQVPIEDIAWDMLISSQHDESTQKQLLWIAARKEFILELLHDWPQNRMYPTQITPNFWGYYEYILGTQPHALNEPTLILSMDGERASITIADRKAIYLTRPVTLRQGDMSDPREQEEREYALASEVERTLYYATDRVAQSSIKEMICCGFDHWKLERMQTIAKNNDLQFKQIPLNIILDSFSNRLPDLQPEHSALLCIAYCRLQRHIAGPNLLEVEEETDWKSYIPDAAIPSKRFTGIATGLVIAFLCLWIGKGIWFNHAVQKRLEKGNDLIQLANQLQREETGLRQLSRTHINYADLFLFLAEKLPNGILVKHINLDIKTGVELALKGGNNQQAVSLQQELNKSPYFRDIVLDRSVVEKDGFTIYLKGKLQVSR